MVLNSKIVFTVFFMLLILLIQDSMSGQKISFGKYSTENGLSNNRVFCMLQDRYGFLWFGTDDGLNRFDGYEFKVYRNDPLNIASLSDNSIRSIFEDRSGYLWIGTKSGELNRYNPVTDKFENWKVESVGLQENSITCIYQDNYGAIWLGTYKDGLYRFNPDKNSFEHWSNDPDAHNSLSITYVTSILEDKDDELWISTYNGLNKFNRSDSNKPFERFYRDARNSNTLNDNLIWRMTLSSNYPEIIWLGTFNGLNKYNSDLKTFTTIPLPDKKDLQFGYSISSIVEDKLAEENILWLGTFGGLIRINLTTGYSERFISDDDDHHSIISNQIHDLYRDRSGVIWIATDNGINYFSPKSVKFNYIITQNSAIRNFNLLFNKFINSIRQSTDRNLWFGTAKGLFSIPEDAFSNDYAGIANIQSYPALNNTNIWSLDADNNHNLWIGTYGQGLKQLNLKSKTIKSWQIGYKEYALSSAYNYVKTIYSARDGMVWIGFWGGGVARLNPSAGEYKIWRNEDNSPGSISYNDVWTIIEDRKGRIWIGTNGGGLNLFEDVNGGIFHHWVEDKSSIALEKASQNLNSNSIYCIYESDTNLKVDETVLWIGTRNGLNRFTVHGNSRKFSDLEVEIKQYSIKDGLPDNSVESIIEDNIGNLWIGTGSGISHFNVQREIFTNYSLSDGLIGNEFNSGASFKSRDGLVFFGSSKGLNLFLPEEIKQASYHPPVVLTELLIFNQPVLPANNNLLEKNIFLTEQIKLSYKQNVFSFQFAALDYNSPGSNQYAFIMEGFDDDWTFSGSRRFVTYTNLNPGEYIFKIKATNSDGIWSEKIASVKVIITPPIYATWYAYAIYVIIFIGALLLIRKYELERRAKKVRERLRKNIEEAELREMKLKTEAAEFKAKALEQEKEIEKQKIRNRIARDLHDEIGSNLSSISLLSRMIKDELKSDGELSQNLSRIESTAKNSVTSIRDIVWFINPASDSLIDLIRKMNETSENMLKGKEYCFRHNIPDSDLKITPEIKRGIYLIFKETLNNITKHSGADKVSINVNVEDNYFIMLIADNGKGYNINSTSSGNGLNNIKSRADELNALLAVDSIPGQGSSLQFKLQIT
jgi:ligand-binding sensor domain-containing protein/signal transduction histidine kinase